MTNFNNLLGYGSRSDARCRNVRLSDANSQLCIDRQRCPQIFFYQGMHARSPASQRHGSQAKPRDQCIAQARQLHPRLANDGARDRILIHHRTYGSGDLPNLTAITRIEELTRERPIAATDARKNRRRHR